MGENNYNLAEADVPDYVKNAFASFKGYASQVRELLQKMFGADCIQEPHCAYQATSIDFDCLYVLPIKATTQPIHQCKSNSSYDIFRNFHGKSQTSSVYLRAQLQFSSTKFLESCSHYEIWVDPFISGNGNLVEIASGYRLAFDFKEATHDYKMLYLVREVQTIISEHKLLEQVAQFRESLP